MELSIMREHRYKGELIHFKGELLPDSGQIAWLSIVHHWDGTVIYRCPKMYTPRNADQYPWIDISEYKIKIYLDFISSYEQWEKELPDLMVCRGMLSDCALFKTESDMMVAMMKYPQFFSNQRAVIGLRQ